MSEPKAVVARHETARGTARSYTIGFILSIILTLAAYFVTTHNVFKGWGLAYALAVLAVTQLMAQLVCFLHLGRESRPRWNLTVALFASMVVLILVFGSLWIMKNLNYMQMTPGQTNQFIIQDEGYPQ